MLQRNNTASRMLIKGDIMSSLGYDAIDIAKWFVNATDRESGDDITHLKVQKLLYYAQGWALAYFDLPFFAEKMEAWAHGPVAPSVWEKLKEFGYSSIPEQKIMRKISGDHGRLLGAVNQKYSIFSAKKLEAMTHSESPWLTARAGIPLSARCTNPISEDEMRKLFVSLKTP
jgi:uncharacterized phage-associated protein